MRPWMLTPTRAALALAATAACSVPEKQSSDADAAALDGSVDAEPNVCGDGRVLGTEVCDRENLAGQMCSTAVPGSSGQLRCAGDCLSFDTSPCACPQGRTRCGDECVDLSSDNDHCGACGWNVVGGRTCVSGRPSPTWRPISQQNAPQDVYRLAFWTGSRFYVVDERNLAYTYDLGTEAWASAAAPPFTVDRRDNPRVTLQIAGAPTRTFVWPQPAVNTPGQQGWIYTDGATPAWTPAALAGAPSPRYNPGLTRLGSRVYVMFGLFDSNTFRNDGAYYDLATGEWTPVPAETADCGGGGRTAPVTVVGNVLATAGGVAVAPATCTGNPRYFDGQWRLADSNSMPNFAPRNMHGLVGVGDTLVMLAGRTGGEASHATNQVVLWDRTMNRLTTTTIPTDHESMLGYVIRMGRSIFYFSGIDQYGNGSVVEQAVVAIVAPDDLAWRDVPAPGRPSGRAAVGGGGYGQANQQETWTGRAAIIFGGYRRPTGGVYPSEWIPDGATYQPPAACVCPAAVPECANVTNVTGVCYQ